MSSITVWRRSVIAIVGMCCFCKRQSDEQRVWPWGAVTCCSRAQCSLGHCGVQPYWCTAGARAVWSSSGEANGGLPSHGRRSDGVHALAARWPRSRGLRVRVVGGMSEGGVWHGCQMCVPRIAHSALNAGRATALQGFHVSSQLHLATTFANPAERLHKRTSWKWVWSFANRFPRSTLLKWRRWPLASASTLTRNTGSYGARCSKQNRHASIIDVVR